MSTVAGNARCESRVAISWVHEPPPETNGGKLVWDLQRVPAFFSWHTGTHLSLIPSTDVRECCKRHRIYLARNIFAINNS